MMTQEYSCYSKNIQEIVILSLVIEILNCLSNELHLILENLVLFTLLKEAPGFLIELFNLGLNI